MRFRRALLALVVSTLLVIVEVELYECTIRGSAYLWERRLSAPVVTRWIGFNIVPFACWLLVLVPLLAFSRVLDRWPLRKAGLLGFVTGAMVTTAILLVAADRIEGTKWKIITILGLLCGIAVAIQFMVVSLTKRWSKEAAVPAPVETASTGQS